MKITQLRLEQDDGKAHLLLQSRLAQTPLLVSTIKAGNMSGFLSCSAFLAIRPGQKLPSLLQTACNSWVCFPVAVTQALLRLDPICEPLCGDSAYQKLCEENLP